MSETSAADDLFACSGCDGPRGHLQGDLRINPRKEIQRQRDESGPARLMARTESRTVVPVEVLVEQDVVAPVRVLLELLRSTVDGPLPISVAHEDRGQSSGDLLGHFEQRHLLS